ncbi:MAG: hypothetical protein JST02_13875 [Bacteroidetes bacterium]|nr:hypothetical protein [Bacteroidota bacterium]
MAIVERYNDIRKDLLYNIILALGGNDMDIEQKYFDVKADLLYAIFKLLDGGAGGGGGTSIISKPYIVQKTFTGAAGAGAVGPVTLPVNPTPDVEANTFLDNLFLFVEIPLVGGVASALNFGFEVDGPTIGLDDVTGLISTLNATGKTRIITPEIIKTTAARNFAMSVTGAPITAGKITAIAKYIKY